MAASIDNSTKAFSPTSVSTLSATNFTIGGNNRVLYVAIFTGTGGTKADPTAVKWGGSSGVSLTQIGTSLNVGSFWRFTIWRLIAPNVGTNDIYASWSTAQEELLMIAVSVKDVDQITPNGTIVSGTIDNSVTPTKNAVSISGDLILDFVGLGEEDGINQTISATAGQTSLQEMEGTNTQFECLGCSTKTASGTSTTMSWTGTAAITHAYNGQFAFALNGVAVTTVATPSRRGRGLFHPGRRPGDFGRRVQTKKNIIAIPIAITIINNETSRRNRGLIHPGLKGPYSFLKFRRNANRSRPFNLAATSSDSLSNFETESAAIVAISENSTIISDFQAESISASSVLNDFNLVSDFQVETVSNISIQIGVSCNSDFETNSVSSISINQSSVSISDFNIETVAIALNSIGLNSISDFETDSVSVVNVPSLDSNAVVISDFQTESIFSLSVGISTNANSDFEAGTLSTVDVPTVNANASVVSDFQAESLGLLNTSIQSSLISDFQVEAVGLVSTNILANFSSEFQAESVISVNVPISNNAISEVQIDTLVSILNNVSIAVLTQLEIETLTSVEVTDNSINASAVSIIQLDSAISVISNIIANGISNFEVESFSNISADELSTSLGITNRFDRSINSALRLIAKNGQKVIWKVIRETKDFSKPWESISQNTESHVVSICFLPVNKQSLETLALKSDMDIPQGAVLGYMGKTSFEPNLKDAVIRNGTKLSIFYIDKLSPNGQNILYTLLLKE